MVSSRMVDRSFATRGMMSNFAQNMDILFKFTKSINILTNNSISKSFKWNHDRFLGFNT